MIHIVEATVAAAKELSQGNCSWLLATDGTQKSMIYPECAARMQYHFLKPSPGQQERVQKCVRLVKAGDMKTAGEVMRDVVGELWRERDVPVTMGCTELPLAYEASGLPLERQVSSLKALSDKCISVLYDR